MKKLIVANWKMNPAGLGEAKKLFTDLSKGLKNNKKADVVVCPPFVFLPFAGGKSPGFKLGAQDCFFEQKGAFTGEVSVSQLKGLGVKYVIVGHSEREQLLKEDNKLTNKKLLAVLKENLIPILCIGETLEQRKSGQTFKVLEQEIKQCLVKVSKAKIGKIIFAYEPLWAIGTGSNCAVEQAETASLFIRKIASKLVSKNALKDLRVLYGGSVNSENSKAYLESEWINGLLVGGASIKAKEFLRIVKTA